MLGLLALPSESLFLVAANAASAAGFLLGRFFVEALLIGVWLVGVRIGRLEQLVVRGLSGIEMKFNLISHQREDQDQIPSSHSNNVALH